MSEQMNEETQLQVKEEVVLAKFEGDPLPENEFERITVVDGVVVSHDKIENGEVVGPVEEDNKAGVDIGRLVS